jgi:Fe-S-cluster-containing dehydrogenase component/DMSO reductase anchor subunit
MTTATSLVRLPVVDSNSPARRRSLVDQYLGEQQRLTAVERFAQHHDLLSSESPAQERYYRDLIPLAKPRSGEQYAFEVDLDACTGCKACVAACHSLNGLESHETWRSVGLLHGGTPAEPVQQPVTTACHHCLDPACMSGCPVGAYEKDALTGIVKHLDDQCIGCQYCVFTCPYEVPQFSERLGIVRKCDMCSDRLAVGEAPACVQSCPNEAIAIAIVQKRQAVEDAQGDAFLPGAPSPGITVPTTVYRTARSLPRNLLPADFYSVAPSRHHAPLVLMLVLTQLSAGAFLAGALASRFLPPEVVSILRPMHAVVALAAGLLALAASVFHLGRPRYAFRALIGLRTSWMSREILAFGVFAALATAYAASLWQADLLPRLGIASIETTLASRVQEALSAAVAGTCLAGVACSILIYHVTGRRYWSAPSTGFKFTMTVVMLGLSTTIATFLSVSAALHEPRLTASVAAIVPPLGTLLAWATFLKLAWELSFFRHLRHKQHTEEKRTALLMTRDLYLCTFARYVAGASGGVLLPLLLRGHAGDRPALAVATIGTLLVLTGELCERTLFFAAVSSTRMPGAIAS